MNKLFKLSALMSVLSVPLISGQLLAATVSGVVTDSAGNPIEGVIVTAKGNNAKVATDDNGRYILENLADGHVHLHVYSPSYVHGDLELENVEGTQTANFTLDPSTIENIVVTANALGNSILDSIIPVSVLAGDELRKNQAPTIGETLKSVPGVNSSYFGPVAASPIIRGNDGPRVKITQNSLDVSDASRVGADHNVGSDAGTAVQIEVLRGPATLQYGSGAIGGVVNVVDNRVPTKIYDGVEGQAEIRHETASNERFAKVDLNTSVENWSFHIDAFDRQTDDVDIPDFANREPEEGDVRGVLPNSSIDNTSATFGVGYVGDKASLGVSVQQLDNLYGIPNATEINEEGEQVAISIDADITRWQLAGQLLSPVKGITSVDLKVGYTDYEHVELEGDEVGTLFANETTEIRLTANNESIGGWHGVVGLNYSVVDFEALGEEAFLPKSDTDSFALFVVEEKAFGAVTAQVGGRIERNELSADPFGVPLNGESEVTEVIFEDLDYTNVSVSAGLNWKYTKGYSLAASLSRSERAPTQQELYSGGFHVSTQSFDLGLIFETNSLGEIELSDQRLEEEVSNNIDVTWRKFSGDWGFTLTAFYNRVDDYLYQVETGFFFSEEEGEEGDIPILNFRQEDAELYGYEAEITYNINNVWQVSGFSDYVRATVDNDDLPRIPPMRIGGEVAFEYNGWSGDFGFTWYDDQDKVANFETETDGYTLVNASVDYTLVTQNVDWIFFARATNITDEEARVHSSFLVDQSTLPGRGFTLGVRADF